MTATGKLCGAVLLGCISIASACSAVPADHERKPLADIEGRLRSLASNLRGEAGIYVVDLVTGETCDIDADKVFPTASMIKVPILAALMAKVDRGELDYRQQLTYTVDRLYAGEDLLGSFADGQKITLDKVAMLMITMSDNTASLWCQELAGTGTAINTWLAGHGYRHTRVNSRTEGRKDDWKRYGWGQTTPREMTELVVSIAQDRCVSPAASQEMQRCLSRIYWDDEALSRIPSHVQTLSKQGAVSHSRSEVVLAHAPHGDYAFCIITQNQEDKSWQHDNAGYVLLRDVSSLLWQHFEPQSEYREPPGVARFR